MIPVSWPEVAAALLPGLALGRAVNIAAAWLPARRMAHTGAAIGRGAMGAGDVKLAGGALLVIFFDLRFVSLFGG